MAGRGNSPARYLPATGSAERTVTFSSRIAALALCLFPATFVACSGAARALSDADRAESVLAPYAQCELVDAVRQIRNPQKLAFFAHRVTTIDISITHRGDTGTSLRTTVSYTLQNILATKLRHYCQRHAGQTSAPIIGSLRLRDWIEATAGVALSRKYAKHDTLAYQMDFSLAPAGESGPPWRITRQIAALGGTSTTAPSAEIPVDLTIRISVPANR
jgi:hypothetical protein